MTKWTNITVNIEDFKGTSPSPKHTSNLPLHTQTSYTFFVPHSSNRCTLSSFLSSWTYTLYSISCTSTLFSNTLTHSHLSPSYTIHYNSIPKSFSTSFPHAIFFILTSHTIFLLHVLPSCNASLLFLS